jgi:hypothetical protein
MSQPCIKFFSHFASNLLFVGMISFRYLDFTYTYPEETMTFKKLYNHTNFTKIYDDYVYRKDSNLSYKVDFSDFYIRKHNPSTLDIIITVWIVGQFWQEAKQFTQMGLFNYLYSNSNTFNCLVSGVYLIAYALEYYTMILVKLSINQINSQSFWISISLMNSSQTQFQIYQTFYWLNSGTNFLVF